LRSDFIREGQVLKIPSWFWLVYQHCAEM
jgi:hypothetical protein